MRQVEKTLAENMVDGREKHGTDRRFGDFSREESSELYGRTISITNGVTIYQKYSVGTLGIWARDRLQISTSAAHHWLS